MSKMGIVTSAGIGPRSVDLPSRSHELLRALGRRGESYRLIVEQLRAHTADANIDACEAQLVVSAVEALAAFASAFNDRPQLVELQTSVMLLSITTSLNLLASRTGQVEQTSGLARDIRQLERDVRSLKQQK